MAVFFCSFGDDWQTSSDEDFPQKRLLRRPLKDEDDMTGIKEVAVDCDGLMYRTNALLYTTPTRLNPPVLDCCASCLLETDLKSKGRTFVKTSRILKDKDIKRGRMQVE